MVELIVVFAIMAVMIAAMMSYFNPSAQVKKARDARRREELHDYSAAIEGYSAMHGGLYYPATGCAAQEMRADTAGGLCGHIPNYLSSCPADPEDTDPYFYYYYVNADCSQAAVYAPLERETDTLWIVCTSGSVGQKACSGLTTQAGRIACVTDFC